MNSAADLLARFRLYRKREYHDYKTETGIFEDLERLAAIEAAHDLSASVHIEAADPSAPICPTRNGQIEAALLADASRSDRSIARQLGCSPTTVGKVRVALGLAGVARSVHRRGQIYAASFRG